MSEKAIPQTIPMVIAQNRFLIVSATVNGDIESTWILDTGAGLEVISTRFFERIRETAEPAGVATGFQSIGTRVDLELYRIPSLEIGGITRRDAIVAPYTGMDSLEGIDGLVSLKFFEDHPFTFDFVNHRLMLESTESLASAVTDAEAIPLLEDRKRDVSLDVCVPLVLNDKVTLHAEFDTGTGVETLIHPYFLAALGIDPASPEVHRSEFRNPDGEMQEMRQTDLASLAVAGSRLVRATGVRATFLQDFIHEGLIGWQLFRAHLVTLDLPNRRMLIRRNPAYTPPETPRVVRYFPEEGAVDVSTDLAEVFVEFSTDMSSAICIGTPPDALGLPYGNAYWRTKRVLAIRVAGELKPGTTYEFHLGIPDVCQLMSDAGVPLPPNRWSFTTRRKP